MNRKPSVVLDANLTTVLQEKLDQGEEKLSNGIELPLSDADKNTVVYRIVSNRVNVYGDNLNNGSETRNIQEDDGIILRFEGTSNGEVAIDTRSGRMLTEEQQELEEEAMGINYPMFKRWEFRLTSAKLTDGPERRMKLHQTYEERKNDEQSSMLSSMDKVFKTMFDRFDGQAGETGQIPVLSEDGAIELLMSQYSGDQVKAMVDMKELQQEHTEQIMASSSEPEPSEDKEVVKLVEEGILEEVTPVSTKRGRPRKGK